MWVDFGPEKAVGGVHGWPPNSRPPEPVHVPFLAIELLQVELSHPALEWALSPAQPWPGQVRNQPWPLLADVGRASLLEARGRRLSGLFQRWEAALLRASPLSQPAQGCGQFLIFPVSQLHSPSKGGLGVAT